MNISRHNVRRGVFLAPSFNGGLDGGRIRPVWVNKWHAYSDESDAAVWSRSARSGSPEHEHIEPVRGVGR